MDITSVASISETEIATLVVSPLRTSFSPAERMLKEQNEHYTKVSKQ